MMMRPSHVVLMLPLLGIAPALVGAWCIGGAPPPSGPIFVLDPDGDDLNNLQEQLLGTDPNVADTDGDGVIDRDEIQDGIRNLDRPSLFSVERFADPSHAGRQVVVIEGTNLFTGRDMNEVMASNLLPSRHAIVRVVETNQRVTATARRSGNGLARIVLSLSARRADRFLGELPAHLLVDTRNGDTNEMPLMPMEIECAHPQLMAAAVIRLRTELQGVRHQLEYVGIGGCGLIEPVRRSRVTTTVELVQHNLPVSGKHRICISGPSSGAALIGSRVLTPVRPRIEADALNPLPEGIDEVSVGDRLTVVTASGTAFDMKTGYEHVTVEPMVADLFIPESHLDDDHDGDWLTTADELARGTDPLMHDSDRDGLHDGMELRLGTDPRDPDSNDDGIADGAWLPPACGA
jgi:hypothetical protein